jgi:hypothetical protein
MNDEQALLEILLDGRSDHFKAKVLEVVYRHRLDVNDPNLQILIATGQLEVLLEEMPDRLQKIADGMGRPWVFSFKIDGAWQTAAFGWAIGVGFASLGWLGGWHMKSAQVYQHYGPAELAYLDKLWQMNSDQLLLCQKQGEATCVIRLGPDGRAPAAGHGQAGP